ncbi:MAG: hypothetical protein QNJ81_10775 [Acidimicrobiia bacterium]|nr:hypothetical protein [Acidimicrobiia bacterium]
MSWTRCEVLCRRVGDDTSIFEADIEWLASAGVTLGCNPPANDNYCPNEPVTRGQMAAFMHRLAVNQVVDAWHASDADNAALFDGSPISHYNNPIYANELTGLQATPLDSTARTWAEYTILTETGGLLINATAGVMDENSTALALFWVQIDDTTCAATTANVEGIGNGFAAIDLPGGVQSMALTGVASVEAGTHTLTLCGTEYAGGGGDTKVLSPSMTAVFSIAHYIDTAAAADLGPLPGTVE